MKTLIKLISAIIALAVLGFAAIAIFVNFYLTDERIKELVIPQAEKSLGRTVSIGEIKVGILSGIKIKDFSIKELDKKTDFISTESFVIAYDLLPLLQKKFIVSEITFNQPSVKVVRDKDGNFNFDTLALLAQAKDKKTSGDTSAAAKGAMPIALTIETIRVAGASLSVKDEKKELPDTTVNADLNVALDLGTDLSEIKYHGDLKLTAKAIYEKLKPSLKMSSTFDQNSLEYQVDMEIEGEQLIVQGKVTDFKTPDVLLNASSQKINLDKLLALAATIPAKAKEGQTSPAGKKGKPQAIAKSFPPGLHVHGLVSIKETIYNKLVIKDFKISHDLTEGILTIKDLSANTAGGSLASNMKVDLNKIDPLYNGSIKASSLDLTKLGTGLQKGFTEVISGTLQSQINFDGAGFEPDLIKKSLSADATYAITNGQIKNTEITRSISAVTGLNELKEVNFDDINGALKVLKGGIIELKSSLNSTDIGAETKGKVDLDGNLDLPMIIRISQALSQKVDKKGSISKFMANEKGETELKLKIGGTYEKPKTSLDTAGLQEQVKETIKTKALQELNRVLQDKKGATESTGEAGPLAPDSSKDGLKVLKGLFGQ